MKDEHQEKEDNELHIYLYRMQGNGLRNGFKETNFLEETEMKNKESKYAKKCLHEKKYK